MEKWTYRVARVSERGPVVELPKTLPPSRPFGPAVLVPSVEGLPIVPVVEPPELNGAPPSVPEMPPVIELPAGFGVPPSVPGMPPAMDGVTLGLTGIGLGGVPKLRPGLCASAGPAARTPAARTAT